MAKVYVRLLNRAHYEENGIGKTGRPGDWIQIGKYQARQWLAQGIAEIPAPHRRASALDLQKCGVVVRGDVMPLEASFGILRHQAGGPALPYEYTVIWDPSLKVSLQGIEAGLVRLMGAELRPGGDSWEALATLGSLKMLAGDVGSPEEQEKTKEVIGSLRLPVYDTRLLWFRKTPATEKLIKAWAAELAAEADEQHSFLRALYSSRIMMCTLPPGWQNKQATWQP